MTCLSAVCRARDTTPAGDLLLHLSVFKLRTAPSASSACEQHQAKVIHASQRIQSSPRCNWSCKDLHPDSQRVRAQPEMYCGHSGQPAWQHRLISRTRICSKQSDTPPAHVQSLFMLQAFLPTTTLTTRPASLHHAHVSSSNAGWHQCEMMQRADRQCSQPLAHEPA